MATACRCMQSLGMWEDMLGIVDNETGNKEGRLFVRDDDWDGSQYIRCRSFAAAVHVGEGLGLELG